MTFGEVPAAEGRPNVAVLLLAAGASSRMRGRDKLLEPVGGMPLLRRTAQAARESGAGRVIVVVPPDAPEREQALAGLKVEVIRCPLWREGMAASLRRGLAALPEATDAVIVALADMPDITPEHFNRLIAAFSPADGREICRALAEDGQPGHPVLFGSRFFESLAALQGDTGARELIRSMPEFVADIPTPGQGAAIDLDTPEQFAAYAKS